MTSVRTCGQCGLTYDDEFDLCAVDGAFLNREFCGPRVLEERYRLDQRLDSGAMGVVYRATHLELGSTVAVKAMSQKLVGNELALARFRREARILGQIKHPNAVLVMDFGIESRAERSIAYLVTEYLRGESLEKRLRAHGAMSIPEVERIVTPLCEAVQDAHRVGVVHRDLKPSNVFLEQLRDGSEIVKVLDFGIAKLITADEQAPAPRIPAGDTIPDPPPLNSSGEPRQDVPGSDVDTAVDGLTMEGDIVGTLPFMAPEQLTKGTLSPATDVYALAGLVFCLLSGRLPFRGSNVQIIAQKMSGARPRLADAGIDVPGELDEFLVECLALEPRQRPSSVLSVSQALRAAVRSAERSGRAEELRIPEKLTAVSGKLAELRKLLESGRSAGQPIQSYETIRDGILSVDSSLSRLKLSAALLERSVGSREREKLEAGVATLESVSAGIRKGLRAFCGTAGIAADYSEYLDTLCQRMLKATGEITRTIRLALEEKEEASPAKSRDPIGLFDDEEEDHLERLQEISANLASKDTLLASEALDELLSDHLEVAVAYLGRVRPGDRLGESLAEGLWHHADALLIRDMYPAAPSVFRLTPFLAKLRSLDAAQPFELLARVFRRREEDEAAALDRIIAEMANAIDPVKAMAWRCLVASPVPGVAAEALRRVHPSDLWAVIAHSHTPLSIHRRVFESVRDRVTTEYRKIFFICIRESMLSCAAGAEPETRLALDDAVGLLTQFFEDSCFHEDVVFEPLLEVESAVREAYASLGAKPPGDDAYQHLLSRFRERGPREEMPLENMLEVPLPIQRKIARSGHFLTYFVAHANERIAMETVPHVVKREDVTPFLKIAKIHRSVLLALVKEERLFRREEVRIALLNNPKTPAYVARRFIPYVSKAYVKQLSRSRHVSAEVRQLAIRYLKRFPAH